MSAALRRCGVALLACGLLVGLALAPAPRAHASVTVPQPISLYKFDETTGATTIADSIRGASGTGTLVGAPTFEAGKVGNAMCLNGTSQYATAPLVGGGLQEFTISAWVKLDTYTQWATVAKNWGAYNVGAFHLGLQDQTKYWSNFIGYTNGGSTSVTSQRAGDAPLGSWQYLVTTASASSGLDLYVNGTKVNEAAFNGTIANFGSLMSFGIKLNDAQTGPANPNPGWLDGCLDEIAFWNVALTEAQLDAIFDGGGGVPEPPAPDPGPSPEPDPTPSGEDEATLARTGVESSTFGLTVALGLLFSLLGAVALIIPSVRLRKVRKRS